MPMSDKQNVLTPVLLHAGTDYGRKRKVIAAVLGFYAALLLASLAAALVFCGRDWIGFLSFKHKRCKKQRGATYAHESQRHGMVMQMALAHGSNALTCTLLYPFGFDCILCTLGTLWL